MKRLLVIFIATVSLLATSFVPAINVKAEDKSEKLELDMSFDELYDDGSLISQNENFIFCTDTSNGCLCAINKTTKESISLANFTGANLNVHNDTLYFTDMSGTFGIEASNGTGAMENHYGGALYKIDNLSSLNSSVSPTRIGIPNVSYYNLKFDENGFFALAMYEDDSTEYVKLDDNGEIIGHLGVGYGETIVNSIELNGYLYLEVMPNNGEGEEYYGYILCVDRDGGTGNKTMINGMNMHLVSGHVVFQSTSDFYLYAINPGEDKAYIISFYAVQNFYMYGEFIVCVGETPGGKEVNFMIAKDVWLTPYEFTQFQGVNGWKNAIEYISRSRSNPFEEIEIEIDFDELIIDLPGPIIPEDGFGGIDMGGNGGGGNTGQNGGGSGTGSNGENDTEDQDDNNGGGIDESGDDTGRGSEGERRDSSGPIRRVTKLGRCTLGQNKKEPERTKNPWEPTERLTFGPSDDGFDPNDYESTKVEVEPPKEVEQINPEDAVKEVYAVWEFIKTLGEKKDPGFEDWYGKGDKEKLLGEVKSDLKSQLSGYGLSDEQLNGIANKIEDIYTRAFMEMTFNASLKEVADDKKTAIVTVTTDRVLSSKFDRNEMMTILSGNDWRSEAGLQAGDSQGTLIYKTFMYVIDKLSFTSAANHTSELRVIYDEKTKHWRMEQGEAEFIVDMILQANYLGHYSTLDAASSRTKSSGFFGNTELSPRPDDNVPEDNSPDLENISDLNKYTGEKFFRELLKRGQKLADMRNSNTAYEDFFDPYSEGINAMLNTWLIKDDNYSDSSKERNLRDSVLHQIRQDAYTGLKGTVAMLGETGSQLLVDALEQARDDAIKDNEEQRNKVKNENPDKNYDKNEFDQKRKDIENSINYLIGLIEGQNPKSVGDYVKKAFNYVADNTYRDTSGLINNAIDIAGNAIFGVFQNVGDQSKQKQQAHLLDIIDKGTESKYWKKGNRGR